MTLPWKERYLEDFTPGESTEFGDYLVTEEEIIEFAQRYDPQPFHIDRVAAAGSMFGGLIGSGWMTGSIMMRLLVDHFIAPASGLGSPGVDEVRWPRPVRAGDRLVVHLTTLEVRRSSSKPDRGILRVRQELRNQRGETVMSLIGTSFVRCRAPAAG